MLYLCLLVSKSILITCSSVSNMLRRANNGEDATENLGNNWCGEVCEGKITRTFRIYQQHISPLAES